MKLRILGAGTSSGVPRIGNDWGRCDPAEPRNRRTRASALVGHGDTRILIDTSPDLREQLLAAEIGEVDAVIWTHDHADHCHGIDDLRQLFQRTGRPIRGLARPATLAVLQERFGYVFAGAGGYPPTATLEPLADDVTIGPLRVHVVDQPHGRISSAGLRFVADGKAIGYATDFHTMTEEMRALYMGLDAWIVDALRRQPHPSHPTVSDVVTWHDELKPARTALIHMDTSLDYRSLAAELPVGMEPGYDGWEFAA